MAIPATQIRRGMAIMFDGEPCRVIEFNHHTPGNLRAKVQFKLRDIIKGNILDKRVGATDEPGAAGTAEPPWREASRHRTKFAMTIIKMSQPKNSRARLAAGGSGS